MNNFKPSESIVINMLALTKEECTLLTSMSENEKVLLRDILLLIITTTLKYKEGEVLKIRRGFVENVQKRTLRGIGDIFRLSPERIRQIEAVAMRKMRHPSRRQKIIAVLPWYDNPLLVAKRMPLSHPELAWGREVHSLFDRSIGGVWPKYISTVGELCSLTENQLSAGKGVKKEHVEEIKNRLRKLGLGLQPTT
ncbi:MAG TPA: sigma factor-like helix-turn-helix DNA-binding protein [Candidatus Paceibacterota bacterium]|nr:sigma factor-like helix-turn-helix DNA-binding protein [Candidatus Paceibacterota bacterium]